MARIAVDMDEVMADTLIVHLARYNADFGTAITPADLDGKWLWEVVPREHHPALIGYLQEPGFFADLPLIPGAQRVLDRLSRDHTVFVASAAMEVPASFTAKFKWMDQHFPFIPPSQRVFCGDKSVLHCDFLIDDNPRQLRLFTGEGLLFSAPHNRYATEWVRMRDWNAVEKLFYPE